MNVNQAAFCTVTGLGAVTAVAVMGAATTASTVATVAYAIFAVISGGASIAAITAWADHNEGIRDVGPYFNRFQKHAGVAIAGLTQAPPCGGAWPPVRQIP